MKLPRRHKREPGLRVSAPDRRRQTPNKKHAQRTQAAHQSTPVQLSAAEVETQQVRNDPDILRSAALATDTPNQDLWNSFRTSWILESDKRIATTGLEQLSIKHDLLETTGREITRLMTVPGDERRPENRAHVLAPE